MTIQEAIRSGLKFRLPGWHLWYKNQLADVNRFSNADLLRDDWEIEEEKVEITRSKIEEAWEKLAETKEGRISYYDLGFLLKQLGFQRES